MHIAIVTDAWFPQVNGVVRSLSTVGKELEDMGHKVTFITPKLFHSLPLPGNAEVVLSLLPRFKMARILDHLKPDAIHIAVEGPLGYAARRYCLRRGIAFSTAYHTKFPEYLQKQFGVPEALTYRVVRRFHQSSSAVMVATQSLEDDLTARGFKNIVRWSRGVNMEQFSPAPGGQKNFYPASLPRPIWLNVGRVSVEKNIEAFLALDLPGSKVVVGDGPHMQELKGKYPGVYFAGMRGGKDLADHYAGADVFVFPSVTDTFGLVLLEALASGLPVAAYPVTGPLDVVTDPRAGSLDLDLQKACKQALLLSPADCLAFARTYSWRASAEQFLTNLQRRRDVDRRKIA
ncbi:MAG: glycosyltransferase family 1 protein [Candidatus Obscuribacterales bacterium]|nr:glycosyltransferase family 1 protein [Candidatus Obscuribacterales bacterium]